LSFVDKKHCGKALEWLGYDPSKEKLKRTLGLEDEEYEKARREKTESEEQQIRRKRIALELSDKKHKVKAYLVLGIDSNEKLKRTLGEDRQLPPLFGAPSQPNETITRIDQKTNDQVAFVEISKV